MAHICSPQTDVLGRTIWQEKRRERHQEVEIPLLCLYTVSSILKSLKILCACVCVSLFLSHSVRVCVCFLE